MKSSSSSGLSIGDVRVAPALDEIYKNGATIKLEPRTMRVLVCLAEHAGEVVSVEQLLDEVWKDVVVSPDSVYQSIAALRRILGDDPKEPTYIANVMRRGYRLVAPVKSFADAATPNADTPTDQSPTQAAGGVSLADVAPALAARDKGASAKFRRSFLRLSAALIALIALAALYFLAPRLWAPKHSPAQERSPPIAARSVTDKSIAVLSFLDMSEKKDQEYFSDGLSEELIDLLAQTPDLQVIAHTSSFYFKGKQVTIAEIAKTLGVANILEGSVRKSGTKLRVTAQLIRADTGTHLWSQTYDRDVKDIFEVQDEVATAVVEALKAKLLPAKPLLSTRRTASSEAYDQFLIGKQAYNRDAYANSVSAYQQAVALDPNFAAAYAGLAEAEGDLADTTGETAGLTRALEAAEHAVALAPDEPDGYAARGMLRFTFFWDWTGGRADIEKAMAYDPGNITTQLRYSELLAGLGQLPEAISAVKKTVDADPLSGYAWKTLGKWLTHDRQYAAARQALNRDRQINPDSVNPRWYFARLEVLDGHPEKALALNPSLKKDGVIYITALAEYSLGHYAESERALKQMISEDPGDGTLIAEIYAWRGEPGKAFEWLDRSYAERDGTLQWIKTDPFLSGIRSDARYAALLKKMNLPE
jgi:TolB-like protein/DNA-binding winged helix-turn-helix (wHTH) protein